MRGALHEGVTDFLQAEAETQEPLPLPSKREKVTYLVCVVGTGHQQKEPGEGVVGWAWETGFTSFMKGKKKETKKTDFGSGRGTEPYHNWPVQHPSP